jgi:hypothetical protein
VTIVLDTDGITDLLPPTASTRPGSPASSTTFAIGRRRRHRDDIRQSLINRVPDSVRHDDVTLVVVGAG